MKYRPNISQEPGKRANTERFWDEWTHGTHPNTWEQEDPWVDCSLSRSPSSPYRPPPIPKEHHVATLSLGYHMIYDVFLGPPTFLTPCSFNYLPGTILMSVHLLECVVSSQMCAFLFLLTQIVQREYSTCVPGNWPSHTSDTLDCGVLGVWHGHCNPPCLPCPGWIELGLLAIPPAPLSHWSAMACGHSHGILCCQGQTNGRGENGWQDSNQYPYHH